MRINFFKLCLLITVLLLSNADLLAQVNWTKYPGNPVFPGQPGTWYAYVSMNCVLYNSDSLRYEMWFTAGAQISFPYTIGFAWSYDGISWNVRTSNPVLSPTPGEWDAYTVLAPYVIRENGQYKMWYTACATSQLLYRIGYATSPDGINWAKHTSNPVFEPGTANWESASVAYGCIMPYSNGYKMWYGGGAPSWSETAIGYATSLDGITWERYAGNPVLLSGATGQWDHLVFGPRVLYIENFYYMYYTGEINLYQSDKIGLATSTDGLVWTKHPSNPVLQPTPGQWDGSRVILGSVLMDVDTLKMYYAGSNGSNFNIGLATSFPFIPVPVELISFIAISNGKEVILNWSTATELNNQLFEVQRSFEGSDFVSVGFVNGKGTTTERQDYTYRDKILADGKYSYRLKQIDYLGRYEYSDIIEIELKVFNSYLLEQNYPNPFNPTTKIGYGIKEKSNVKITILNSIGEEVAMLVNEEKESGYHTVEFNATNLPSGVYFYQLRAGDFIQTKKMLLLK